MATSYRTLDTDRIQVRTIFARTDKNAPIPSSHILIANGDGSTHWSSISTILEISSFRTIQGNTPTTFSADMSYNVLKISTTGVGNLFESGVDAATSTLMLSNYLPPIGVTNGSVPVIDNATATNMGGIGEYMAPVTGNSTIKFLGVRDIVFSTSTAFKATFVTISTFTSQGYLAISGEAFSLRPAVASTFSTNRGVASFVSSLPFQAPWTRPVTATTMFPNGRDLYFSSLGFTIDNTNNNWLRYLDRSPAATTKCFIEFSPSFLFDRFQTGTSESMVKEISSYVAIAGMGTIFSESVVSHRIISQVSSTGLSNSFQQMIRMEVNPYTSLSTNFTGFLQVQVYHRIVDGIYPGGLTATGFVSTAGVTNYLDSTCRRNTGYIQMFSSGAVMP